MDLPTNFSELVRTESIRHPSGPYALLWLLVVGVVGGILLMTNIDCTLLKENPWFWRNAGGYSVELRETVLSLYYPLLACNLILCAGYSTLAALAYRSFGRGSLWIIAGAVLMWSLLFLNIGLLTSNNLENLMNGKSLHYHSMPPSRG